jgi:hypothetical protein
MVIWSIWVRVGKVTVLDPSFHVIRFSVNRLRMQRLVHGLGLGAKPRWACSFLLRYRGDLEPQDLQGLRAFLISSNGLSMELPGKCIAPGPPAFTMIYPVAQIPADPGPFTLAFRLPSNGKVVATWSVGDLR